MGISDWSSDVCSSDLRALEGKAAWMSGLRRAEAATRGQAPIVVRDLRGLVKVNPIATWTDADVEGYIADHDVPVNPLKEQGYLSIGCMPCTSLPNDPDDPRSGRWAGKGKTEDRKSVEEGKRVQVRVDLGGRRFIKKKKQKTITNKT